MKNLFFIIAFLFAAVNSFAQSPVYVSSYTKSNGTYVQPHYRSSPNSTRNDNFNTVGNINPYTGEEGTKPQDSDTSTKTYSTQTYSTPTPTYSTTTPVYTGPRGGQYYINSNGNKTLISN